MNFDPQIVEEFVRGLRGDVHLLVGFWEKLVSGGIVEGTVGEWQVKFTNLPGPWYQANVIYALRKDLERINRELAEHYVAKARAGESMKAEDLLKMDIAPTEIPFPPDLAGLLGHFKECQIRRRVYVYMDSLFLPRPGYDYKITQHALTIPHPIRTLEVITVSIPSDDERWYYSRADGWGRL